MSGVGPKVHHIYMIDFGLAKKYYTDGQHIKYRNQVSFTGTARYASINAHKGIQQTRRDDLEAIGHMLLYFLRGSLPWSGMSGKTEEKYRKICAKKSTMPLDELCAGFPDEFKTYLRDVRKLGFRERPNYAGLRQLFSTLRSRLDLQDHDFEWLEGKRLDTLEPLLPQGNLTQPDDGSARDRPTEGGGGEAVAPRPPRRGLMTRLLCGGRLAAEA
jgi:serine/threonine protein kinase